MRKLLFFFYLSSAVACSKQQDEILHQKGAIQKLEWHVHASENHTGPLFDSLNAGVGIRIYKTDTAKKIGEMIWDTTFIPRAIVQYPGLPQKHVIKKQVLVLPNEKLQVWYNIRYQSNNSVSENARLEIIQKPFTFIDVCL